jgi:hypothetical protein
MTTHNLKTVAPYFEEVWQVRKSFEVRENDRDFKVGDILCLKEWDYKNKVYTGREVDAEVTYILYDFRDIIREGYVVMAIALRSMRHLYTVTLPNPKTN